MYVFPAILLLDPALVPDEVLPEVAEPVEVPLVEPEPDPIFAFVSSY